MLGRRHVRFRLVVAAVEGRQVQRHPVNGQCRQPAMPGAQTLALRIVQRHGDVRGGLQDLVDELGQHPARTHLDEPRHPIACHRRNHLAEPHGLPQLIAELISHPVAIGLRRGVRVDREAGPSHLQCLQICGERLSSRCHDR